MGKEQNRLVLTATSLVFLLLLTSFYAAFFASDVTTFKSCKHNFFFTFSIKCLTKIGDLSFLYIEMAN